MTRQHPGFDLRIPDHALMRDRLARLREAATPPESFRVLARQITFILACAATRDLATAPLPVTTPLARTQGERLQAARPVLAPILRAGLGMLDSFLELLPEAVVVHLGFRRDEESLQPVEYYCNLPSDLKGSPAFVLDPMLATGGSVLAAAERLRAAGCAPVTIVCLVAAPEGLDCLAENLPGQRVVAAVVDDHLDERGYIVPGLGDAGDRLFST